MSVIILMLAACGVQGGMGEPAPPPLPPARFSAPDDGLVEMLGTIGDVSPATRSFTITSEGRLRFCVLTADANVLNNGHASALEALAPDQSVIVSGKLHGDVVVAQLVAVGALAAVPALGTGGIEAGGLLPAALSAGAAPAAGPTTVAPPGPAPATPPATTPASAPTPAPTATTPTP